MRRTTRIYAVLGATVLLYCTVNPSTEAEHVAPLIDQDVVSGCGCYFELEGMEPKYHGPYVLMFEFNGPAYANLDGEDRLLAATTTEEFVYWGELGKSASWDFRTEPYEANIRTTTTWVCPDDPNDEACEVNNLEGAITFRGPGFTEPHTVVGSCGC